MKKASITTIEPAKLSTCANVANEAIDNIISSEAKFIRESLPARLEIGLACVKAHELFAMSAADSLQKARKSKSLSSRREDREVSDESAKTNTPPTSFTEWLERDIPRLKEAVAYKYMKAIGGLGLESSASPADIVPALEKWEATHGAASLAALVAASTLALDNGEKAPEPQATIQDEFEFMKSCASDARQSIEAVCNIKDKLPDDFKRALSAQLYTALWELTGTHWAPSDEAPDLANVDPSSIQI